jgi:hypothetical protein
LFVRETGTPLFEDRNKEPDQGFANMWNDTHKYSGIELELPFRSLRDALPDYLRAEYDSEIGRMCLTHGALGADQLIGCYSNKPWKRFHEAVTAAREYYAPVLTAVRKKKAAADEMPYRKKVLKHGPCRPCRAAGFFIRGQWR